MSDAPKPPRPYDTFLDWFLCHATPREREILPQVITLPPWALSPEAHRRANDFALAELAALRARVAELEKWRQLWPECYNEQYAWQLANAYVADDCCDQCAASMSDDPDADMGQVRLCGTCANQETIPELAALRQKFADQAAEIKRLRAALTKVGADE